MQNRCFSYEKILAISIYQYSHSHFHMVDQLYSMLYKNIILLLVAVLGKITKCVRVNLTLFHPMCGNNIYY